LGQLVERVSGMPLADFDVQRVFRPAGMLETRSLPPAAWLPRIAPTEQDPWRQRKLRGEVHDENAARVGSVSGHAGLFSTAHDLSRFARLYLNEGRLDGAQVFDAATLRSFVMVQDTTVSRRALGWETPTGRNSAGQRLSAVAFGHTGFTGTSLWMDPGQDLFVLLLTNRVNPTRQNTRIGAVRTALADAVAGALPRRTPGMP
jgi:CubicO group peptidase (beta-lactamase class C family)